MCVYALHFSVQRKKVVQSRAAWGEEKGTIGHFLHVKNKQIHDDVPV